MFSRTGKIAVFILLFFFMAASVQAQLRGGKLVAVAEYTSVFTKNFNPYSAKNRASTMDWMFEPLVVYNDMNGGERIFRLATAIDIAPDLRSLTYTLRKGVKWSDGEEFNADDVIFSYNLMKKHPALDRLSLWNSSLEGVAKINSHSVRFDLNRADATFEWNLVSVPVIPQHIWKDVKDPVTFTNADPVGTGPFTEITDFRSTLYEQCRNPHYWEAGKPYLNCLRFPQFAETSQSQTALYRGEVDWAGLFIPDIQNIYVKQDPKNHKYWFPASGTVAIHMNTAKAPFNDVNFRRAVSAAIDRDAIVEFAGFGYPSADLTPGGLGGFYKPWFNQKVIDKYGKYSKFNPKEAKKILKAAGYRDRDGDGFLENPDGSKIEFDILVPGSWTDWLDSVNMVSEALQEVGIKAKVNGPEAVIWTQKLREQNFDMAINGHLLGPTPWTFYETSFHSRHMTGPKGELGNRFAPHGWRSVEMDALIEKFGQVSDDRDRKQLVNRLQEIVAENVVIVPLFSGPAWYQYNEKRFTGWVTADNAFVRPELHPGVPERLLHVLEISRKAGTPE